MQGSLPVASNARYEENVFMSGDLSEMSADQYLCWVRDEAERLPRSKVAQVSFDTSSEQAQYMPQIEDIASCDPVLVPDDQWVLW